MDDPGLASAARRLLRSSEAGTLEVPASGVSGLRTPFVLSHEGRPALVAPAAAPGQQARLAVRAGAEGAEPRSVQVDGTLREARAPEAARLAAFLPGTAAALVLEPRGVEVAAAGGSATLAPGEFLLASPEWAAEEQGILDHMNEDHEDAMLRMSLHFHGVEAKSARLVAADPEGLHVRTDRGVLYFPFDRLCVTHEDVHQATVRLARAARLALASR
jgi:hypothetical protein